MVEVLGGVSSDFFHYFQVLLLRGFLAARRDSQRLLLLVRLMATENSRLACFQVRFILFFKKKTN